MSDGAALVAMSHSPLLGYNELAVDIGHELDREFDRVRQFALDCDPDLVVVFFPDHYNGLFYDVMPPFCIAAAATSIGDYTTAAGPLDVDEALAERIAGRVLGAGLDTAVSYSLQVDHGAVQPLEILFGRLDARPVLPIFINCVAPPLGPMRRIREFGEAIGAAVRLEDRRVLFVASGGLSHDPPVPRLEGAAEPVRAALLGGGRNLDDQARGARQRRVIDAGAAFARGESDMQPLAPEWDLEVMGLLAAGDQSQIDMWSVEEMTRIAGHSSHEVRTWVGAYSALGAFGPHRARSHYYRAIPELIAGFGIATAVTAH